MKRLSIIAFLALAAALCSADVTNYVYTVSNIYIRVFETRTITNRIQNTAYFYHITNNVTTITNIWTVNHTTNFHYEVVNTNFGPWIVAASNQANRASEGAVAATNMANVAASHASRAGSYSSSAQSYASLAQAYRNQAQSAATTGLENINARIAWFDEWASNKVITVMNTNITIQVNAQNYSYTYSDTAGTVYSRIVVHPYGANGGATIEPYSAYSYNTVAIRAWPRPRVSGYWDFYPAYIDYDSNGMRLQYLPDTTTAIPYQDGNGAYTNGKIVPEYFYWQNGNVYFKVRVWDSGSVVAWCICRYQWDSWPTTIGYGGSDGTAMTLVDRSGYGDNSMGTTLAYFYSLTRTSTQNSSIEFPMNASSSFAPTLQWMRNGPQ